MDGKTFVQLAYDAIFKGDFEQAVSCFQQAMELDPDNASYVYRASITCARSGKLALALEYGRRALRLVPDDPQYAMHLRTLEAREMAMLAQSALSASPADPASAVPLLRSAVALDPLSMEARLLLGIAYRLQRKYADAVAVLREAQLLDPQHEEAARLLSEVRGERRRALKQLYSNPKKRKR